MRLKAATRNLLMEEPETIRLLDRLTLPRVSYQVDAEPTHPDEPLKAEDNTGPSLPVDTEAGLIIWNDAIEESAASELLKSHFQHAPAGLLRLGSMTPPEQTQAELATLIGRAGMRRIWVITKGWEPPVLAFDDFLQAVRAAAGKNTLIEVVPIDVDGKSVQPASRGIWSKAVSRLRDTRTQVVGIS
jgi:hypothetical protein